MIFLFLLTLATMADEYDCTGNETCNNCLPSPPSLKNDCLAGSYAYAAAYVFAHRLCIASSGVLTNATSSVSAQELLSCDANNVHCGSDGSPLLSLFYIQKFGISRDSCFPLKNLINSAVVPCSHNLCDDFTYSSGLKYFCKTGSVVKINLNSATGDLKTNLMDLIKNEISSKGAVIAQMDSSSSLEADNFEAEDFMIGDGDHNYISDVGSYEYVAIIGYGGDYWKAITMKNVNRTNSYFFKIKMEFLNIGKEIIFCDAEYN